MIIASILLLVLVLLFSPTLTFDPTAPPAPKGNQPPRKNKGFVNPIKKRILRGTKVIRIRVFARIPDFVSSRVRGRKSPSRLVGLTSYGKDLYVTTSTAGALIYRVTPNGKPKKWANIAFAVKRDTGRRVNCETTQHGGLRGVAFPVDHSKTGLFYVSYMEDRPKKKTKGVKYFSKPRPFSPIVADSVVVEFKYNFKIKKVKPGSYRTVIRIGLATKDHPIKQITFQGRFLLIGHGDGSLGSNPSPGGMNNDGLGKILRIDPRKKGRLRYTIPKRNPFRKNKRYRGEIFALGFRNPHNICYSKKHGIFVADVGRDNVEEVNIVTAGRNYGWGKREGTFVNLFDGGTITGIGALPKNDAKFKFTYPNVQIGHAQPVGGQIKWGIAIAGSCPVDNGSPLRNMYLYANFGERGELYYSWVGAMKRAKVRGNPKKLTQANVYRARRILFDHDGNPKTPPKKVNTLVGLVNADINPKAKRVDARFGRGPRGEIYIMSKATGTIYLITSSLPGAKK